MIDWKNVDNSFKDEDGIKVIPGGSPMIIQGDGSFIPVSSRLRHSATHINNGRVTCKEFAEGLRKTNKRFPKARDSIEN